MKPTAILSMITSLATVLAGPAGAAAATFDLRDPKGVNTIAISLDSLMEPIVGYATGISGQVSFDPAKPDALTGTITVAADSIAMAQPRMTTALHSEEWLDVKRFPAIEFVIRSARATGRTTDHGTELLLTGDFTCHGVTKSITVTATVNHLPDRLAERNHKGEGDLLVIRSTFRISRKEFGIKPDLGTDLVADDIELRVGIVGSAPR